MGWTVVEEFVEPKMHGRMCEDLTVITPHYAAVIDGASDATGLNFAGLSGGRMAAESVRSSIEGLDSLATARQFADELSTRLARAVGDIPASARWPAATVVCLSFHRNEIWRVGDGSFVVDGKSHVGSMRVGDVVAGFRAAFNTALLASGSEQEEIIEEDPGAVVARSLTNLQQHLSNRPGPWGYGVINGRPIPDEFLQIVALTKSVREVVLTSDGFPDPRATLDESEAALRKLLSDDPAAVGDLWAAGKPLRQGANSIDDRAYLRMRRR